MKVRDLIKFFRPDIDVEKVEATIVAFTKTINTLSTEFVKWYLENQDTFKKLSNYFGNFTENEQDRFRELMKRSWFIDLEIASLSFIDECALLFREEENDAANCKLVKYYEEVLPEIEKRLYNRHPLRRKILKDIFTAYKGELYSVVIPTVFTQVDGICKDVFGGELFMREDGAPKSNKILKQPGMLWDIIALPLITTRSNAVLLSEDIREKFEDVVGPIYLNRHAVIHGEDLNYNTKDNALRALSLLAYIDSLTIGIEEEKGGL
jgi:hypothetical protein